MSAVIDIYTFSEVPKQGRFLELGVVGGLSLEWRMQEGCWRDGRSEVCAKQGGQKEKNPVSTW